MTEATRNLLEQHFDTAFAAPDGIKKLRELILTLAMHGKLVEQDPSDPPASELLKEIEAEKQRLVKEGKIKKPKPLPPIKPEEVPYELPQGWKWVRLAELTQVITKGSSPNWQGVHYVNEGEGILFITSENVGAFELLLEKKKYVEEKFNQIESRSILHKRDILMNIVGASIGRTAIFDLEEIANINQAVTIIRLIEKLDHEYFLRFFNSQICLSYMFDKQVDNARPNLSMGNIALFAIPLPPLPEQHRIVALIDQLMARCDELEKLRKEREEKRLAVHAAAIKQLLEAPDGSAWDFIQQHFGELYTVKENLAELRKAILQLAVMGRLVPQDAGDPPASALLKEIEAEKQRLVKAGKIKKPKPLPPIKPEEVPYNLPQGWEWVRFFEPNTVKSELVSARDLQDENQIAPDSIEKDTGRLLFHRTVAKSGVIGPNNRFYEGQILYSKIRPSLNKVVVAPYDGLCSADMYPIFCHANTPFMLKVILSEPFLVQVRLAENRVKMPKLNLESLGQFVIPLPPLLEQHRIVTRIDQLMVLCDTLEQQIDAVTSKQTKLLSAVMAQV